MKSCVAIPINQMSTTSPLDDAAYTVLSHYLLPGRYIKFPGMREYSRKICIIDRKTKEELARVWETRTPVPKIKISLKKPFFDGTSLTELVEKFPFVITEDDKFRIALEQKREYVPHLKVCGDKS